jgi:hypothetical protein
VATDSPCLPQVKLHTDIHGAKTQRVQRWTESEQGGVPTGVLAMPRYRRYSALDTWTTNPTTQVPNLSLSTCMCLARSVAMLLTSRVAANQAALELPLLVFTPDSAHTYSNLPQSPSGRVARRPVIVWLSDSTEDVP